jgi:transcriptional regulator with XRE-family HTH domain
MNPLAEQLEQIAPAFIAARLRAGLSQRALGAKVGLAQSHISKIERSAVDPQISSLVEIARALGLELMLVPRQLVPAVQALQREAMPDPRLTPNTIDHDLTRLARQARDTMKRFPELRVLSEIASAADDLRIARLDESSAAEARSSIDAAKALLYRLKDHSPEPTEASGNDVQALAPIARTMRNLRNVWIHRDVSSPQSPAYRLDDSDA